VATVGVAAWLRWLLQGVLGPTDYPFFLFNIAVIVCARYGTLGSSLFACFLGGFVSDYLFVDPKYTLGPTSLHAATSLATYYLVSISICVFAEGYRKALEQAEKAGSRLQLALSVGNAATFDWSPQDGQLRWSDEYHRMFGMAQSTALTLRDWLAQVHPEDRERVVESLSGMVGSRAGQLTLDFRITGAEHTQHWVHARLALVGGEQEPAHVIGAIIDVTQLKNTEAALIRSEKLASAGKMAATLAHEVNNPLAAATNLLFLAREAPGEEQMRSYLEAAEKELGRVAMAARRTLAFYREKGSPAPVSIEEVLRGCVQTLSHKIEAKGIRVRMRFEGGLAVRGVSGELGQVFTNLIANSVDATPMGGVIVIRTRRHATTAGVPGPVARVTIADNGCGIRLQDLPRLSEPFFSTKGAAGTGLGLWVARDILRRHQGKLHLRSQAEGRRTYTLVTVLLPALPQATSATSAVNSR
jgi:PAS domain S-box-containing protein